MKIACMNIDRLVNVSIRSQALPRKDMYHLYQLVAKDGPVSWQIAHALLKLEKGATIGLITGASDPSHYPNGESDGPPGAAALAFALHRLGYRCIIYCEENIVTGVVETARVLGYEADVRALELEICAHYDQIAEDCAAFIAIEKQGLNEKGIPHTINGTSRAGQRCIPDYIVAKMNAAGKLTIGIGDGGNEVGFGKIFREANEFLDYAGTCKCGCGGSIITICETTYLFPCAVSNWGAYAVCAALAMASGRKEVAVTSLQEHEMLKRAIQLELGDGGSGKFYYAVDGVSGEASVGLVTMIRELALIFDKGSPRGF